MASLHSLVEECVAAHTQHVAVVFDYGQDVLILTYGEMWKRAVLISKVLQHHGVSNQIVGMCIPPSLDLPSVFLGVLLTSSAVYPFETDGLGFVKQSILKMHVGYLLIYINVLKELENMIGLLGGKILHSTELIEFGLVLINLSDIQVRKNCVDLAYCLTTSGTTAEPKVVRVPHSCILPNIKHLRCLFEVTAEDMTLLASPLTFDPSIIDLFVTLTSGATILIVPNATKLSPQQLIHSISEKHKTTILQVTPALLSRFSAGQLRSTLLSATSALRILAIGGERFPSLCVVRSMRAENNKTKIFNLYGITELSCWATVQEITPLILGEESEDVSLGHPLAETSIKVLDERGETVQEGEGEIFIGSSTRRCYVDEENVDEDTDDNTLRWRQTGDVVRVREDGSVFFLHRTDEQVKRNGKRLDTKALQEVVLSRLDKIRDCRALTVDSELVMFVSTTNKSLNGVGSQVEQCIKTILPQQYWPDRVCALEDLPLTKHGKLDTRALIQIAKEPNHHPSDLPPGDKLIEWSQNLWKDLLATGDSLFAEVEESDNFISLGGDSFKAVQLINRVERCFHTRLPLLLETVLNKNFSDFVTLVQTTHLCSLPQNGDTVNMKNRIWSLSRNSRRDTELEEHQRIKESEHRFKMSANSRTASDGLISTSMSHGAKTNNCADRRCEQEKITPQCPLKRKHKSETTDLESEAIDVKCKSV